MALLCSILALGLSAYTFYLTTFSNQGNQLDTQVGVIEAQVNSLNDKASDTDQSLNDLQEQLSVLANQQDRLVDIEAVEAVVSEQVDKLAENLPGQDQSSSQEAQSCDIC